MWGGLFIAFGVAVLAGMGVGGAGVLVTWLTLVADVPQLTAQGINLLFFLFSSGAALCVHAVRTPVLGKLLYLLIPAGLLGAFLGSRVALWLPTAQLRGLFGILLILSGVMGLFAPRK